MAPSDASNFIWGADAIAAFIGKTPRATKHLLALGHIPGAAKVGKAWVLDPAIFRECFKGEKAA